MSRPDGERLAVLETKLDSVEKKLDALAINVTDLTAEMQRRQGAERVAKWIVGLVSGGFGATVMKLLLWAGK